MTDAATSRTPSPGGGSRVLAPDEPSSGEMLWAKKWLILAVALLVGILAFGYAATRTSTYAAQATVRVSLLQNKQVGAQNAIAANELAAQYSQIVTSDPVLDLAAPGAKASGADLRRSVSATPIDQYNVIGVSATASSSDASARRAVAVAQALVEYLRSTYDKSISSVSAGSSDQVRTLNKAIKQTRQEIKARTAELNQPATASSAASALTSANNLLASLLSLKENAYLAPIMELRQARPSLTVLDTPSAGSQESQHATVYGVVGAVVGGLVAVQLFLTLGRLRARRHDNH